MKYYLKKLLNCTIAIVLMATPLAATAKENANLSQYYLNMALTAMTLGEKNYYLNKAKDYFLAQYEKNQENTAILIGLGKTYCYLDERTNAKNYLMKAYNLCPNNPQTSAALGDFNFYFQDYVTALEFYKLALSSGFLKDYKTNLSTALCHEKLADTKNAILYYKIAQFLNPSSKIAKERLLAIQYPSTVQSYPQPQTVFDDTNSDEEIQNLIENTSNFH